MNIQIVYDYDQTDCPYKLPPPIRSILAGILDEADAGLPVRHKLKEFIKKHPEYPEPRYMLFLISDKPGKDKTQREEIINAMLKDFPDYVYTIVGATGRFMELEKYDEAETIANLNNSFEELFPNRKKVLWLELLEYELVGIIWHLANSDTDLATLRCRRLFSFIPLESIPESFLHRILKAYLAFVPKEEFSKEDQDLFVDLYWALDINKK